MARQRIEVSDRQRLVADRIRELREARGWSQEYLAHEAKVNRSYFAVLESGRRNPTIETLCKVAAALGVDVADLVRGAQDLPGRPKSAP